VSCAVRKCGAVAPARRLSSLNHFASALSGRPCGDDDCRARLLDETSIRIFLQRIEVDGVAGRQLKLVGTDGQFQFSLNEVEKLDTGMEVRGDLLRRQRMEVRQETIQPPFVGTKIQSLKVPRNLGLFWIGREYVAFAAS
jgi:hypothetical protein